MSIKDFFKVISNPIQRHYEAMRAFYIENFSIKEITKTFGLAPSYFKKLRYKAHQSIKKEENPFFINKKTGPKNRSTKKETIEQIINLRKKKHSITDIQTNLKACGTSLSISCIYNILKEKGFSSLARRTKKERSEIIFKEKNVLLSKKTAELKGIRQKTD